MPNLFKKDQGMENPEAGLELTHSLTYIQPVLEGYPQTTVYVGGLPTDLLLADRIYTSQVDKTIEVDDRTQVPLLRPNRTLRDIDIMCFSDDKNFVTELHHKLHTQLSGADSGIRAGKVSVSGYEKAIRTHSYLQLVSQVSKREEEVQLSIGPIAESLSASTFEERWTIKYRSMHIPIHHPIAHMYNYRVRSLAGLRPKDSEKVLRLEQRLRKIFSEDQWEPFSPYGVFEARVDRELRFLEALRCRKLQNLSMSIAQIALRHFEASPTLTRYAQQDSGPLHILASKAVRMSRKSFSG
jgi:hypothetical protein